MAGTLTSKERLPPAKRYPKLTGWLDLVDKLASGATETNQAGSRR